MRLKEDAKKVEDGNSALMLVGARLRHMAEPKMHEYEALKGFLKNASMAASLIPI